MGNPFKANKSCFSATSYLECSNLQKSLLLMVGSLGMSMGGLNLCFFKTAEDIWDGVATSYSQ